MKRTTIKLPIDRCGINGEGIGFQYGKPVFVEGALMDEVVEAMMVETTPRYGKAKLKKVIEPSPHRIQPKCRLSNRCDGCGLNHCDYAGQLMIKTHILNESLLKYGPTIDLHHIHPIVGSSIANGYRDSCKLYFGDDHGKLGVGLYRKNSHDFVLINDRCMVHDPSINALIHSLLHWLNHHHIPLYDRKTKSGLRGMCIRVLNDQASMVLVGSKDVFDRIDWKELVLTTGVSVMGSIINTKREIHNLLDGMIMYHTPKHALSFEMNDMVYTIRPQAFFQLNPYQLVTMIDIIASMMPDRARVFEGYCGIGILGLALHTKIKSLIGVEIIDSAIVDARNNARRNHITGYTYYCGDSATLFRKLHMVEPFDVVLLDPPRSGLDPAMIQTILASGVPTIIYVSCNPVTLAKNLKSLSKHYRVDRIQSLDMFPFTPHVEVVCLLSKLKT